jgi:hypothetical protein
MDGTKLRTIAQLQDFLKTTPHVSLCGVDEKDADERYAHISRERKRFDYPHRKKTSVGWYWPTCSALAATAGPK